MTDDVHHHIPQNQRTRNFAFSRRLARTMQLPEQAQRLSQQSQAGKQNGKSGKNLAEIGGWNVKDVGTIGP